MEIGGRRLRRAAGKSKLVGTWFKSGGGLPLVFERQN
jgi:hypothetical protein